MATLQTIRSKGPLLIIVIGIALFAFIAGDAWRIFQPNQGPRDIGEVNGESVSAYEYQQMLDEYTDIIKFSSGNSALSDEQLAQIKDEVWRSYVNNKLIENEAEKIGLTVSNEEVQAIIDAGTNPILQQTPFRNPQTGAFDKDMLKKFLVDYSRMANSNDPSTRQLMDYYQSMYQFWKFIEKNLIQSRLAEKYQNLIANSFVSNPVEAQASFDARVNQYDMLLAAVPYTSIPDSLVKVTEADLKKVYDKKKEQYKQPVETRNIKYIDVQITPSEEDRATTLNEVTEYANQLEGATEYVNLVRASGSEFPYIDVFYSRDAYPTDITARLDSVSIGEAYGPYYNQSDNSYNAFKIIAKQVLPDSVELRQIQVYTEDVNKTRILADSIYNALRGGANFTELATKYSQDGSAGAAQWINSKDYEGAPLDADNTRYINTINSLRQNEIANVSLAQGNAIIQVVNRKGMKDKYKVAVVKRPVEFSKETYNKYYNDFSQFVAANGTLTQLTENAEEQGYRLLERNDFYSSEHQIGGIRGTREAIRWIFEDAKPGDVSSLYEVGDKDRLLVVALEAVNKEGYRPFNAVRNQIRPEVIREKKAERIIADIKGLNITTFENARSIPNVLTDSIKHVSFAAPAYASLTRSSEPVLGAYASSMQTNQLSSPVQGNAGVFLMQVYNKEALNETFDLEQEKDNLTNTTARMSSRFINDLYMKANVRDSRYLFF